MSKINFTPLYNNIMVEEVTASTKTDGGIIKPAGVKEEIEDINKLEIMSIGSEVKHVKVGDIVSVNAFAFQTGTQVKVDKKLYRVFPENLIIGIYTPVVTNILDTTSVIN